MKTIGELFARKPDRKIEEVIKLEQSDEESVRGEIDEYVATDALKDHFHRVYKSIADAVTEPHEGIGIWVSGFFGSGKSSFAKILGYTIAARPVGGSNRTIIKQAQQMLAHQQTRLADRPVGTLVTLDLVYELLYAGNLLPSEVSREVDEVPKKLAGSPMAARVAKAIALLEEVKDAPRTSHNLAVVLQPSVDAESVKKTVEAALKALDAVRGQPEWDTVAKSPSVTDAQRDAVIGPLVRRACQELERPEGSPMCARCRTSLNQLEAEIALAPSLSATAQAALAKLLAPTERVERVGVAEFLGRIQNEKDIEAAIGRLSEHRRKLLAEGVRIVLE